MTDGESREAYVRRIERDLAMYPADRCDPKSILTEYRRLLAEGRRLEDLEEYVARPEGATYGQCFRVRVMP